MIEGKPDIKVVLTQEGVDLRRGWGSCPFHADKHPSMKIDRDRQIFHCFGCGAHGDVIDFIQRLHNLSFKDALRYLGMTPGKPPQVDPKEKRKRELLKGFDRWQKDRYNELCDTYNAAWHVLRGCRDMGEIEKHAPMIHNLSQIEGEIGILREGTDEQRFELFSAGV